MSGTGRRSDDRGGVYIFVCTCERYIYFALDTLEQRKKLHSCGMEPYLYG